MPNPFNQQTNNLQSMYNMFKNSRNPQELFMNYARNNPQMQPIMNALQSGGDPQQLFYSLCQQRGVNPQQFLNNITGNTH